MIASRPVLSRAPVALRAPTRQVVLQRPVVVAQAAAAEPVIADEPVEIEPSSDEARAILRFHRGSASKVRRVLDAIRGRSYEDALKILTYLPHRPMNVLHVTKSYYIKGIKQENVVRPTEPILKTLLSAGANAKHNLGMRKSKLYVSECFCDEGPTMKRFRPRAQGRAFRIMKRTSHITIKVAESD